MTPPDWTTAATQALDALGATQIECGVADFSSVARGKVVARADFLAGRGCRLPSVALGVTLTGGEPAAVFGPLLPATYQDLQLQPDLATLVGERPGRASVLCEPTGALLMPRYGREIDARALSPRAALRRVIDRLAQAGLQARVAPELEFFLVERHVLAPGGTRPGSVARGHPALHPVLRSAAAPGGSGAREAACEIYSLERTAHFSAYFDALFGACERAAIPLTGHAHEAACSQYEVNFAPGEPLVLADAVFRFKRLARQIAVQMGFLATFIAKPFLDQPGNGMHWHVSLLDTDGRNAFSAADGSATPQLAQFIGGLQRHAPALLALLAPFEHSFERMNRSDASPASAAWGHDDRGVAFRIPHASAANRRVENRLPGGDASPYLTVAATLGLGLLGIEGGLAPASTPPALPTTLTESLQALDASTALRELLGDPLVDLYVAIKQAEVAERQAVADPRHDWDLLHLLEQA